MAASQVKTGVETHTLSGALAGALVLAGALAGALALARALAVELADGWFAIAWQLARSSLDWWICIARFQ